MKANTVFYNGRHGFHAFVDHQTGEVWIDKNGEFEKSFFKVTDKFYWDFYQTPITSDLNEPTGGPSDYYDFLEGWQTWNDLADYKSKEQWKEHSFHLGNIGKAIYRWGEKKGTTKLYDAKKIVYSAIRVMLMLSGKEQVKEYLEELKNDPQFK